MKNLRRLLEAATAVGAERVLPISDADGPLWEYEDGTPLVICRHGNLESACSECATPSPEEEANV